jgi:hypothetical protein
LVKIASILICPFHVHLLAQSIHFVCSLALCSLTFWLAIICLITFILCSYYVSISSQSCFPHLFCNVYHPTYIVTSSCNVSDQASFISSY